MDVKTRVSTLIARLLILMMADDFETFEDMFANASQKKKQGD